jgi:hypothetical protein
MVELNTTFDTIAKLDLGKMQDAAADSAKNFAVSSPKIEAAGGTFKEGAEIFKGAIKEFVDIPWIKNSDMIENTMSYFTERKPPAPIPQVQRGRGGKATEN